MNKDFHYYGTYVAARLADYDLNSAQKIAHSAQYVDDSNQKMLQDSVGNYFIKDFNPVPTVQDEWDMARKDIIWSEGGNKSIGEIWIPFHFLPGNYGDNPDIKEYKGPKSDRGLMYSWEFDNEAKKQFKLLCKPNSLLVKSMVNDIIQNHTNKDYTLQIAGLRMHVLADTWAHMFYIGIPEWFANNAGENVYNVNGGGKKAIEYARIWPWADSGEFISETATPNMMAYNSLVYLGHGRMGHVPDYPWLKYQYRPQWSDVDIVKDNTTYFLQAFKQIVKSLQCIKNKIPFETNSYAEIPADTEAVINQILSTQNNDQCDTWVENIGNIKIAGKAIEIPEVYDKNKWINEMKSGGGDIKNTSYYHFNQSASYHLKHVKNTLQENNIYIHDIPKENIVSSKFKSKKGKYIGNMYKGTGKFGQYYPKLDGTGINIQIIKATNEPLADEDDVEIKTTEPTTGEYNFLGAWSTDHYLYYYIRAYSTSKQKWIIEKVDTSVTKIIKNGDQVRFKNQYYTDEPYMATCEYKSIWGKSGTYLTSQKNGSVDEAVWIMDGLTQIDVDLITNNYFVSDIIDLPTSTSIHGDLDSYGIIDQNNKVDIENLETALDNIGLAFIHTPLNADQMEQVRIKLYNIVNLD